MKSKLRTAGVKSTKALLESCCTHEQRAALAQTSGIPESKLLELANIAALRRVAKIPPQYSELLAAVGVHSVRQLASRNAWNLTLALATANATGGFKLRVPSTLAVCKWIDHARSSPQIIEG